MPDILTDTQQEFIHRLQYQDMDQIAEDLELSLDTITDWQKDHSFQSSMMESVSILKQKVRHRVLLRCLSLMDSLDHLREHINPREQTRILEHVAGIINKVEIVEASVVDSIRQQEIEDARCWREYSKDQRKILAWERYKREFEEWKKKPKDPNLFQPPPSTFELFFDYTGPVDRDEDDDEDDEDYEEDDAVAEDQETEPSDNAQTDSTFRTPHSELEGGPGEGSNQTMDK